MQGEIAKNETPRRILDEIKRTVAKIIKKHQELIILAIGVALPGPFLTQNETIALMTESSGWSDISIKDELMAQFVMPAFLEHDANSAALAQLWHDRELQHVECLAYIAAGQGIGSGIVYKGELLRGEMGIAGEIGHTSIDYKGPSCSCGNKGCLEKYCSSIAFTKRVNAILKSEKQLAFGEICDLAAKGDQMILGEYAAACEILGFGMANLVYNFNPAVIVIGDEMAHIAPDIMLEKVTGVVKSRILPVLFESLEIKISKKVRNSTLHGAAIIAISHIFANSGAFLNGGGRPMSSSL